MRRRGPLVVTLALGAVVAVGVPAAWVLNRPEPTVGGAAAEALAASASPTAVPAPRPGPRGRIEVPGVPVYDGRLGHGARDAGQAVPRRIDIPAIAVSAQVLPTGVQKDGELQIPENVGTVGWYEYGPTPGASAGSAVMSGHVDSAAQGRGAFYRLRELGPGARFTVLMSDGRVLPYRVVAREEWSKKVVPLGRIFSRDGAPRVTLVTCGGGFREDIRSYVDNIAVTAVQAAGR